MLLATAMAKLLSKEGKSVTIKQYKEANMNFHLEMKAKLTEAEKLLEDAKSEIDGDNFTIADLNHRIEGFRKKLAESEAEVKRMREFYECAKWEGEWFF